MGCYGRVMENYGDPWEVMEAYGVFDLVKYDYMVNNSWLAISDPVFDILGLFQHSLKNGKYE